MSTKEYFESNGRRWVRTIDKRTGRVYTSIRPICFIPVVDSSGKPLMPTSSKRCTRLLKQGKAIVYKMYPIFTIRMINRYSGSSTYQDMSIGIDPGSRYTGVTLVRNVQSSDTETSHISRKIQINHKGHEVKENLQRRAGYRNNRRYRKVRYRKPRFLNRVKPKGWVPPSLISRIDNIVNVVKMLSNIYPIMDIKLENVSFDVRKMMDPNINGKDYQKKLYDKYSIGLYLRSKYKNQCQYCNTNKYKDPKVRMTIDHIVPRSKGGSNNIDNLTLACERCNRLKSNLDVVSFYTSILKLPLKKAERISKDMIIRAKSSYTYKEASIVQSMKTALLRKLRYIANTTKYNSIYTSVNRTLNSIPKSHTNDAALVGFFKRVCGWKIPISLFQAVGKGRYQRFTGYVTTNNGKKHPRHRSRQKEIHGFRTGDIVLADTGAIGRVNVRRERGFRFIPLNSINMSYSKTYRKLQLLYRTNGFVISTLSTI